MSNRLNCMNQIILMCLCALLLCAVPLLSAQAQQGSSTPASSTTRESASPQKKKLPQSSRGFEKYAGRDASDRLIAGAATRTGGNNASAHFDQGMKNYQAGQLKEAASDFMKSVQFAPEWADAHYSLATVYGELGEHEKAVDQFKRASRLKADDDLRALIYYNMGNAYADLAQYESAIEAYKQVMILKPELPQPHYNTGLAYAGLGKTDKAIEEFKEAVRLKPEWAEAHFNLAVAYLQAGKKEAALEEQRILKNLQSDFADKINALVNQ